LTASGILIKKVDKNIVDINIKEKERKRRMEWFTE